MRVEITIAKSSPLPSGALEALTQELGKRIHQHYPDTSIHIRYAAANNLSVLGGNKDDKERISELLQETWESADDWFMPE
ncbi:DNA damage-inducible protein I [Brenneria goodwinii]|uniref:DNA damage-inducible protein I n=1 Tax=Brenneria goodwinii TaxID=1109412 RepID=A0A0G4JZ63_9GAMM|nr:DNA damage-inducible protein I [Brenneria goodwinii]ATA23590.1 damage-inducible protein I [Brenneria goodwinii]MCG8154769.1 DNA damage-inducible protein I [Brenneria goodwinii]MCG8159894.1 DNA damage-inducible protein I [Brenneria goodwinii]MCG8164007.1 DNA damage-inducible protein I [Brenneria goodwinii]MCG8168616.1 DNA damage-inducible protein I [Brenneria goodwinii]